MWVSVGFAIPLAAQEKTEPDPQPKKLDYVKHMEESRRELRWSKIYKNSFDRTKEYSYLQLSAKHGLAAIQSYYWIQTQLKRPSTFTYETKRERLDACKFHELLVRESLRYDSKNRLENADPKYCQVRVK